MLLLLALTLPIWNHDRFAGDWLVDQAPIRSAIYQDAEGGLVLANGLIARHFRLAPNAATVGLENLVTRESLLRAVEPEAIIQIDGKKWNIGGLGMQPDRAYLDPKWLSKMPPLQDSFVFQKYSIGEPEAEVVWRKVRHSADVPWPPKGISLTLQFAGPEGLEADVRYELYDGIPVISKRLTLFNKSSKTVRVDHFDAERLAAVEGDSQVDDPRGSPFRRPPITVCTDYSFGGMMMEAANGAVHWDTDPAYTTQVNYDLKTPCLLRVSPAVGPSHGCPSGATIRYSPNLRACPRLFGPRADGPCGTKDDEDSRTLDD